MRMRMGSRRVKTTLTFKISQRNHVIRRGGVREKVERYDGGEKKRVRNASSGIIFLGIHLLVQSIGEVVRRERGEVTRADGMRV